MEWLDDIARGWASEYPGLDLSHLPPLVRLARLGILIEAFQHDVLQPFGLSPGDYGVLASLRRAGPPYALNPSQLYGSLRRSSGGMTKMLKRLEQAGLVERTPDPEDGRGSRVMLTARGLSLQDRVFRAFVNATRNLLAPLPAERLDSVDAGLSELLDVFEHHTKAEPRSVLS
jgi:DNA-binding MarR family transcriptional regulator